MKKAKFEPAVIELIDLNAEEIITASGIDYEEDEVPFSPNH